MVTCSATATKAHKLETSSKTGWMKCSQPSLSPARRDPTSTCSFWTPDPWLQGTNRVTQVPEDIKSTWEQLQAFLPAQAVLYKCSVNPPNTTPKPPESILLGSLAQPITDGKSPHSFPTDCSQQDSTDRHQVFYWDTFANKTQSKNLPMKGIVAFVRFLSASKLKPPSFLW